jgi:hypothetical protein
MNRTAKILASALVALAFVPATASARLTTDAQRVAYFKPLAERTFPGPCAGHETVTVTEEFPAGYDGDDGLAFRETCTVYIRPSLDDQRFCETLVHEMGHLAGLEHTTDGGVMDIRNGASLNFEPCVTATQASLTSMDRLHDLFPNGFVKAKRVARSTRAYRHGVRWVIVTRSGRWFVRGTVDMIASRA